jgi:hypothetical protein
MTYWIEKQLSDSGSQFYPGAEYQSFVSVSNSPRELINKLMNHSWNVQYAAPICLLFNPIGKKRVFLSSGVPISSALFIPRVCFYEMEEYAYLKQVQKSIFWIED